MPCGIDVRCLFRCLVFQHFISQSRSDSSAGHFNSVTTDIIIIIMLVTSGLTLWQEKSTTCHAGERPPCGHELCAVLCAVCCVLCAVCCVLCAVCCVLCAVCCVLCAVLIRYLTPFKAEWFPNDASESSIICGR
jgi:ABC-type Fe3+ transport system permease subunit